MSKSKRGYTRRAFIVLGGAAAASATIVGTAQAGHHPKLVVAITALEEAHAYMRAASHDFGGHRKEAMEHVERTLEHLRLCSKF
jgi:hypothetical protein